MDVTIPDGMPSLSAGDHEWDEGEACVMEYVSVLAGERFSDSPACTHPVIACAARYVNDRVHDEDRHLLVPIIHRLVSAGPHHGVTDALYDVLGIDQPCYERDILFTVFVGAAVSKVMGVKPTHWFGSTPPVTRESAVRGVALLTRLLDVHERVTGVAPKEIREEALRGARRLIDSQALVLLSGYRAA